MLTRAHTGHVTCRIDNVNSLCHFRSVDVSVEIEEVEREPRHAKNQGNANQQAICALHTAVASALDALINRWHVLRDDEAFFEPKVDLHVGRRDHDDWDEVLQCEGENAVVETSVEERKLWPGLLAVRDRVLEVETCDVDVVVDETAIDEKWRGADDSDEPDERENEKSSEHLQVVLSRTPDNDLGEINGKVQVTKCQRLSA